MKILYLMVKNHPIIGDIELDFTDVNGNPIDNIIFAGENGCGKTTILEILSNINNVNMLLDTTIISYFIELDNVIIERLSSIYGPQVDWSHAKYSTFTIQKISSGGARVETVFYHDRTKSKMTGAQNANFTSNCIYLTPEITFQSKEINSITARTTDEYHGGLVKSTIDIATSITQLIIDIDNQDNNDFCELYSKVPSANYTIEQQKPRISRFNNAFKQIFTDLSIHKIDNINGHKTVLFNNRGNLVSINSLSTGEKQIVFRGGFLLQIKNSTNGALILIDEPEISLHPDWQRNISNFYKKILTDAQGIQTSQIFFATHSPFVVHNDNRINEKVIILKRDDSGKIIVDDNPEYYLCDRKAIIKAAFNCTFETPNIPTVYLEGRTDEKYFNKALEVFEYTNVPFQFKWIGYLEHGQEVNTGKDALAKAGHFLISNNIGIKYVLLFDCDTRRQETEINNVYTRCISTYENSKRMKIGIENALILDKVDLSSFYSLKEEEGNYGENKAIQEFQKMRLCESICSMGSDELQNILANLKTEIDKLFSIFNK